MHYPKATTEPPSSLLPPLPYVLLLFLLPPSTFLSRQSFFFIPLIHFHPSPLVSPPLLSPPFLSPPFTSFSLSPSPSLLPSYFCLLKALSQCRYDRRALPGARGKFSAWSVGKLSSLLMRHTWRTSEEPITLLHRLRLEAMTTVGRERGENDGGGGGKGGGEGGEEWEGRKNDRGGGGGSQIALYPSS